MNTAFVQIHFSFETVSKIGCKTLFSWYIIHLGKKVLLTDPKIEWHF